MEGTINIKPLFSDCIVTECCRVEEKEYELYPEERVSIQNAVAKRQREFGAGRLCARKAMARLGIKDSPLLKGPDGSPVWPAGIVGAISHSNTWCGSAVARQKDIRGIGLDIETIDRVNIIIAKKVLSPVEMEWVNASDEEAQKRLALLFSAKETIFKCVAPVYGKRLGFFDMVITHVTEEQSFEVKLNDKISTEVPNCSTLTGRYLMHEGDVFTGMVLYQED
ncbi:MAG: 4'-phosphopantetheinyl transferase superfamily protein [Deltaproteobacteria bacterium]|nr:4'-phosphopantetheinyl transferase superfamily protein [Deltaproteobacteria bacterium]